MLWISIGMVAAFQSDPGSPLPLYRQLYDYIRESIELGSIRNGEKLPPTRELAGQLGLNRTTVSAAYALLEENGLIEGQVGRGSFVRSVPKTVPTSDRRGPTELISFASSRPADREFPLVDFQTSCGEVIGSPDVLSILQLGSPFGYAPLRRYLLDQCKQDGSAGPDDDILVTSGCQQAFDLVQRVLTQTSDAIVLEDPVYHGLRNVFTRSTNRLLGVSVAADGIDLDELDRLLHQTRPALLVVTPNFQNPTGATMTLTARERLLDLVARFNVTLVENDIYGSLRYRGEPQPTLKQLDRSGQTLLLRSFSKIAFPGLRVGWVVGPRALIARLAEARQWCDLHTDQLSQAILLRFAESGRLASHQEYVRRAGLDRLEAALEACDTYLPPGSTFTRPEGGMNIWVRLAEPLHAAALLPAAERELVTYLPGSHFAVARQHPGTLRLSFGSLTPERIRSGIAALGRVASEELEKSSGMSRFEAASALV